VGDYEDKFWDTIALTTPDNLPGLSVEELQTHYYYLVQVHRDIVEMKMVRACADRMELLLTEIELRRSSEQSGKQHKETMSLGSQTLNWAKIAGIAAIASVALSAIALYFQIAPSKAPLSIVEAASPSPYQKTPAPISVSPVPVATSSIAKPSPTETAITGPSPSRPSSLANPAIK
jgi:hypothetical protein